MIKIAGRRIRTQSIAATLASLRAAKAAGVRTIMFTSDNFNKYPEAQALLEAMVDERLGLDFFVQCDTQIAKQEHLVELLGRAGCFQMFVGVESFNRQTLLAAHKGQNRPETYRDIVRLCRQHGFTSHFSNIIGFPQDTEQEVREHLEVLREMAPTWASFYILCPIPGTEQYDDFMARGLITETNLDRFDTTCLTWRHPHLSRERLSELLFTCYRRFFSAGHALQNVKDETSFRCGRVLALCRKHGHVAVHPIFAWRRMHPMSGGIGRVRLDGVGDYLSLRKATFDVELAPLPSSLHLPAVESQLNQVLSPRGLAHLARMADQPHEGDPVVNTGSQHSR